MRVRACIVTVMMVAAGAVSSVSAGDVMPAAGALASTVAPDQGPDLFRPARAFVHPVVRRQTQRHAAAPAVRLAARGWSQGIAGEAAQFYGNADPARFDKHPIGSGYLPVPGDVVVWSGGTSGYGHVAIVVADAAGTLTLVEQNSTISGYGSIAIDATGAVGSAGGLAAVGFLHAKANPLTPQAPTSQPSHTVAKPPTPHRHVPRQPSDVTKPAPPVPSSTPSSAPTPTVTPTPVASWSSSTPTATSTP